MELGVNRRFTTMCDDHPVLGAFPHGQDAPTEISSEGCLVNPNRKSLISTAKEEWN